MLRFRDEHAWLFGTRHAAGTDLELLGNRWILCLEFFTELGLTDLFELDACHFQKERGLTYTRNPCNHYPLLIFDLLFLLNNLLLRPVNLMNIEDLNFLPNLPPQINFFLIGGVGCLNLVNVLKDLLVVAVVIEELLDLLDII
jgi:hypothetical protein